MQMEMKYHFLPKILLALYNSLWDDYALHNLALSSHLSFQGYTNITTKLWEVINKRDYY